MSTTIFEKYAAARQKFPEDIERIATEEQRVKELLMLQELSENEAVKHLIAECRRAVITARKRLATDRSLIDEPAVQCDLWNIVDARLWVIQMLCHDFKGELALIEAGLDAELQH